MQISCQYSPVRRFHTSISFSDSSLKIKILATDSLKCKCVHGHELHSLGREGADCDPAEAQGGQSFSQESRLHSRAVPRFFTLGCHQREGERFIQALCSSTWILSQTSPLGSLHKCLFTPVLPLKDSRRFQLKEPHNIGVRRKYFNSDSYCNAVVITCL